MLEILCVRICEAESWYNVLLGLLPELRSAGRNPSQTCRRDVEQFDYHFFVKCKVDLKFDVYKDILKMEKDHESTKMTNAEIWYSRIALKRYKHLNR